MRYLLDKLKVHHTRNDIYDTGVFPAGSAPKPFRLIIKDTTSMLREMNLRRTVPKLAPSLSYTLPRTNPNSHVNKTELLPTFSGNCIPLTDLQQSPLSLPHSAESHRDDDCMRLHFRFLPERSQFQRYEFRITEEANKMLKHVFTSLGLSNMFHFSTSDIFLNTRVRGGLHHLLQQDIASSSTKTGLSASAHFSQIIEVLTYYKGLYGRLIILTMLGVGCTAWYTFHPGVPGIAPPELLALECIPYESFHNVDFHLDSFKKMSFVEHKYITDQVLSAFENLYPFSEIDLAGNNPESSNPESSNPNARVAIGLGLIVAVFLAMGMTSSSPCLELVTR